MDEFDFKKLQSGDIIYAEKIMDKINKSVDRSRANFKSEDDYVTALHTAIYVGNKDQEIWHATLIEGESCYWSLEKFNQYYLPIVAKRIIIK